MPSNRARSAAGVAAGVLTAGALMVAAAPPVQASPAVRAVPAAVRHVVHPGESVQQAVDRARPGDTIVLLAGAYPGGVLIRVPHLTLRGAGRATVIAPLPGTGRAATTQTKTRAAGGTEATGTDCSAPGYGICVLGTAEHPLADVTIESLTVSGFAKDGIAGSETTRMAVRDVLAEGNGEEGISQEKSARGLVVGSESRDNGEAGVFITNIAYGEGGALDTEDTLVLDNRMTGNRFGAVLRRVRNMELKYNTISGNCSGVFVIGDENRPRGGASTVRGNNVNANNKFCASDGRLPILQGIGIVLTGVEKTVVAGNRVVGNAGAAPMSGGIVLFHSFNGGPDTDNTITRNVVTDNKPADVADRDGGPANSFRANICRTAEPAGRAC